MSASHSRLHIWELPILIFKHNQLVSGIYILYSPLKREARICVRQRVIAYFQLCTVTAGKLCHGLEFSQLVMRLSCLPKHLRTLESCILYNQFTTYNSLVDLVRRFIPRSLIFPTWLIAA